MHRIQPLTGGAGSVEGVPPPSGDGKRVLRGARERGKRRDPGLARPGIFQGCETRRFGNAARGTAVRETERHEPTIVQTRSTVTSGEEQRPPMAHIAGEAGGNGAQRSSHSPEPTNFSEPDRNRRTRGSAPARKGATPGMRSSAADRRGGESTAAANGSLIAEQTRREEAASDDANGAPAARTALSAAAGAGREAYAEVAESPNGSAGKPGRKPGSRKAAQQAPKPRVPGDAESAEASEFPIGPGALELAEDGGGFVDEMHARVDLWECGKRFLVSLDEKVAQRTWERLLEMKYGKGGGQTEEPFQLIVDGPRPVRPEIADAGDQPED